MFKSKITMTTLAMLLGTAVACGGTDTDDPNCSGAKCDDDGDDGIVDPPGDNGDPQFARFRNAPATACIRAPEGQTAKGDFIDRLGRSCIPGILPPNSELAEVYQDHTDSQGTVHKGMNGAERRGLAAWTLFSGDGKFLRRATVDSEGNVNALRALDVSQIPRNDRFERFGIVNDPGCRAATAPDEFGLMVDECDDPYSAGAAGFRLKPNPDFDPDEWEALGRAAGGTGADGHYADAEEKFRLTVNGRTVEKHGWEVEPPYLPSLTCGSCHVAPNPLEPPVDVNNPRWNNIVFGLGNQFFKEGPLLGAFFPEDDFLHQVLHSQQAGTSDTSRVATDNIYNPNVINSIANLAGRPVYIEDYPKQNSQGKPQYNPDRISCDFRDDPVLASQFPKTAGGLLTALVTGNDPRTQDGECVPTLRVLKGGGDSSGPTGAVLRVYVNVGSCVDHMLEAAGGEFLKPKSQTPISRQKLHDECSEYQDMEQRVIETLQYLAYLKPYRLEDAPGGSSFIDDSQVPRGEVVFAENCATCHSSVQPEDPNYSEHDPATWFTPERAEFFKDVVAQPDFRATNFLADDRRYPVDLLGTNMARAYATNATGSHIWEEYGSATYRNQPSVQGIEVSVPLPFGLSFTKEFDTADNGKGYYRTPTLTNIWNSAPFFHNNGLGIFNGDPSVAGRVTAFEDAAQKLLLLRERDGEDTIRRTTRTTKLMSVIPIFSGWPIDTFANLGLLFAADTADVSFLEGLNPLNIVSRLEAKLVATDPIQDKGHLFGVNLSDADKTALIEYLKTL